MDLFASATLVDLSNGKKTKKTKKNPVCVTYKAVGEKDTKAPFTWTTTTDRWSKNRWSLVFRAALMGLSGSWQPRGKLNWCRHYPAETAVPSNSGPPIIRQRTGQHCQKWFRKIATQRTQNYQCPNRKFQKTKSQKLQVKFMKIEFH